MSKPAPALDGEAVRVQVRRIAASPQFSQSDRLKQFLQHVTERTLAGCGDELKESVLALEVFGRNSSEERPADSLVRVTASKVRAKLKAYYLSEGFRDDIIVELPKGAYVPVFHERQERPKSHLLNRWVVAGGMAIFVVSGATIGARLPRPPDDPKAYRTDPAIHKMYLEASHYGNSSQ